MRHLDDTTAYEVLSKYHRANLIILEGSQRRTGNVASLDGFYLTIYSHDIFDGD